MKLSFHSKLTVFDLEVSGLWPRSYHFVRQYFANVNTLWFRRSEEHSSSGNFGAQR